MSWPILIACLAVVALWAAAVFVRAKLEAMARRAWHRIACAWMQCDEAPVFSKGVNLEHMDQ